MPLTKGLKGGFAVDSNIYNKATFGEGETLLPQVLLAGLIK